VPVLQLGCWHIGPLLKEVLVSTLQIHESLLQDGTWRFGQPSRFRTVAPFGEKAGKPSLASIFQILQTILVTLLLNGRGFVVYKTTRASKADLDILPGLKAGDSYRVAGENLACNASAGSCFGDPPGMIPATAAPSREIGSIHRPSGETQRHLAAASRAKRRSCPSLRSDVHMVLSLAKPTAFCKQIFGRKFRLFKAICSHMFQRIFKPSSSKGKTRHCFKIQEESPIVPIILRVERRWKVLDHRQTIY
jgi:hypothetical protein